MNKPKIKITPNNSLNSAEIKLSGDLLLNSIDKFLPEINSVIDKFAKIKIIGEKINEIDLSAIQVFYSIAKTGETEKKEIKFDFSFSEKSEQLIKNSGFSNFFNI
jgi:hypothetical protein